MTNVTGSASVQIRSQATIAVPDQPGHMLMLAEAVGTQKSSDPHFDLASLLYASVTELNGSAGTQRGYYVNTHPDGDADSGAFEGNVTVENGLLVVRGTYQQTAGTGKFKGSSGSGSFTTRFTSATDVEVAYQGSYQLAARAAG